MMEALFQLDRFGWLLIDVAWKSTVLLLVAYTADRLFLRRRLIAADVLWSSTLLMLVLMPLCCLLLPKYTIEVPSPYMQQADSQATRSSYIHTNNAIAQPLQLHELLEVGPVAVVTEKPVVEKADVTLSSKLLANGMPIVSLMYCLGTLVLSVRLASGLFLIRRLTRTANPISSDAWMKLFHHHKQQLGIRRAISLNHSPKVSVPLTIGWIRPVVILPTSTYNEYTRRTIEVVILHELTHIARGDYFVHIITKFAQCLYWYNPLMWIASWRHCHVRETVCDGYCISSLKDRDGYVSVLLVFAQRLSVNRFPALGIAMIRVSRLEKRISNMMPIDCYSPNKIVRLTSLLIALVITTTVSVIAIAESYEENTRNIESEIFSETKSESVADVVEKQGETSSTSAANQLNLLTPLTGLDNPTHQPIRMALSGRSEGTRESLLGAYGGTAATQDSVMEGLSWLARNQLNDGLWSLVGPFQSGLDKGAENKEAATAMALIAFQGTGITPESAASDPFTKVVRRAWDRFLKQQDEQGNFFRTGRTHARLYTHAIATIALCELYGMTGNSRYRESAQRAIDYCVKVQSPEGGWRYFPGKGSDTSVTGWFVMALQSARMAGLNVPSDTLTNIGIFLDAVEREGGRRYAYQSNDAATRSMSAEGLLCRQYLGWSQSDPRLQEGADLLLANLPTWESGERNAYYWYHASQVCHHMEGRHWRVWNQAMREVLPAHQIRQGREQGSWDHQGDRWGNSGGRLTITCLSIYMLEVYYRHLPIYQLHQLSGQ